MSVDLTGAIEAAVRESIAVEIEAQCKADDPPCARCWAAAKLARGESR